jgi:hypothetical protein
VHFTVSGAVEFAKENLLPGPEKETAAFDDHGYGTAHEGSLDVAVGIAFHVPVACIGGCEFIELLDDVAANGWICAFVDGDPRCGVGNVNPGYSA